MVDAALGRARLVAQGLVTRPFAGAGEVAATFGALQGQDLPGVLASLALRTTGGLDDVLAAFARGEVVRGYPMRGTLFALPAADARWITELCSTAQAREVERRSRNRGLEDQRLRLSAEIAEQILEAGPISRADLLAAWEAADLLREPGDGYHLVFRHVVGGRLCYGPIVDGDHHVVLAASWLPAGSDLESRFNGDRDAATVELLRRYLTSHGPATIRDFAWWSKLPITQIRRAHAVLSGDFEQWPDDRWARPGLRDEIAQAGRSASRPMLLPGFDEFILGYQDRLFAMTQAEHVKLVPGNNGVFQKSAVSGGRVVGLWKVGRGRFELTEFKPLADRTRATFGKLFATFPR